MTRLHRSRAAFVAALGAAAIAAAPAPAQASETTPATGAGYLAPYHVQGDLTGDGQITTADLDQLVDALGLTADEPGFAAVAAADYDDDGEIGLTDVADLSQRIIYDDGAFELVEASVLDMQAAMNAGVTTSVEITQDYLDRIEAYDALTFAETGERALNSIVTTAGEKALEAAAASDAARAENGGPRSMLDGIPVLVKDNFNTADMPTSAGHGSWKDNQTDDDAFMVEGLREAGAVILGKASLDEWALGFSSQFSTNSPVGQALAISSPYALDRTAGGSSGGTGASIAANLSAIGFGTDTGGSIRVPASYNQLVGVRPTVGLASRDGIVPLALSQDTGGPMTRTVADAAIALDAVVGVDPADPITSEQEGQVPVSYTSYLDPQALQGKRIGVFSSMVPTSTTNAGQVAARRLFEQARADLVAQGATVVEIETPEAVRTALAEPSGSTNEFKRDLDLYIAEHLDESVATRSVRAIIDSGHLVPGRASTYEGRDRVTPEQYQAWMDTHLAAIAAGEEAVLEVMEAHDLDAFAYPSGTPYGTFGQNMRLSPNTGMPAVSVPMGQATAADGASVAGAGVNLELLGRAYAEGELLGMAYAYEQATAHRTSPALFPALEK